MTSVPAAIPVADWFIRGAVNIIKNDKILAVMCGPPPRLADKTGW